MSTAGSPKINLIPWDHRSQAHIDRMVAQRRACGWGADEVPSWAVRAEDGLKTMFWVELSDSLPNKAEMLESHRSKYPDSSSPLKDTATTRSLLLPARSSGSTDADEFIPVGHVALNKTPTPDLVGHFEDHLPEEGVYWIANLWVSATLQGGGIGRAVMSQLEALVIAATGRARAEEEGSGSGGVPAVMALDTIPTEMQIGDWAQKCFYEPFGLAMPKVSNQQWYERQGYAVFRTMPSHRHIPLKDGNGIDITIMLLKKVLEE